MELLFECMNLPLFLLKETSQSSLVMNVEIRSLAMLLIMINLKTIKTDSTPIDDNIVNFKMIKFKPPLLIFQKEEAQINEEECEKALEVFEKTPDVSFIYALPEEDYKAYPRKYKWRYLYTMPLIYLTNLMVEKLFIRHKYFVIPDYLHNTIYMKLTPAQVNSLSKLLKPVVIQKPKPELPTIVIEFSSPDKLTGSQFDYSAQKLTFKTPKKLRYYPTNVEQSPDSQLRLQSPTEEIGGTTVSPADTSSRFLEQRVQFIKSTREQPRVPPTRGERDYTMRVLDDVAVYLLGVVRKEQDQAFAEKAERAEEARSRRSRKVGSVYSGRSLRSPRSGKVPSWDAGREDSKASFKGTDEGNNGSRESKSMRKVVHVGRSLNRKV